jgi:ribosomal protein L6P/L9E
MQMESQNEGLSKSMVGRFTAEIETVQTAEKKTIQTVKSSAESRR